MTRRAWNLTFALLLTASACSSQASSGTASGATAVVANSATTAVAAATSVAPTVGDTTTPTASGDTVAPPLTLPPAPAPTAAPTAPPTTVACRNVGLHETARRGDCGDTVTFIQERLTLLGFPVTADGRFGPGTERVVKDFQTARGLTADGIVGENTWAALVEGGIGD